MTSPFKAIRQTLNAIIVGKSQTIDLALAGLLAQGHLLFEDLPGVGKTTLSFALAKVFGLQFQRIQFTSDLLPADILGASIFDRQEQVFTFHPGPVFSQVVLADEINRATPKTQSALLEAMEEGQVSADGRTYALPVPFFVIATQNPLFQIGTFPLPESQLDRFLLRLRLGFPDRAAERELLEGQDRRTWLQNLEPLATAEDLAQWQAAVQAVKVAPRLLDYLQDILQSSRQNPRFGHGLSPRAGLALRRAAQAWAFLQQRDYVLPEDVQMLLAPVVGHRLAAQAQSGNQAEALAQELLESVAVPR